MAQSGGDMAAAVQGLDFLPEILRTAAGRGSATARGPAARKITALLEPLFLPLVQALLFVLLCMIVRWVFALLVRRCCAASTACRWWAAPTACWAWYWALCTGALDCWLLALLLWFAASVTAGSSTG